MHLKEKPTLYIVDEATAFQAAKFIPDFAASTVWEALETCWINTYLGPPDFIITDAGTNFVGTKFKQPVKQLSIEIKEVLIEAYNSISKVERYYTPLRRAYKIIRIELKEEGIDDEVYL